MEGRFAGCRDWKMCSQQAPKGCGWRQQVGADETGPCTSHGLKSPLVGEFAASSRNRSRGPARRVSGQLDSASSLILHQHIRVPLCLGISFFAGSHISLTPPLFYQGPSSLLPQRHQPLPARLQSVTFRRPSKSSGIGQVSPRTLVIERSHPGRANAHI